MAGWADQHPAYISGGTVTWLNQPFPGRHASVLLAVAGAVLLACYGLVRRRSLRQPLSGALPGGGAVSVFGAITLALLVFGLARPGADLRPHFRPVIAACLVGQPSAMPSGWDRCSFASARCARSASFPDRAIAAS